MNWTQAANPSRPLGDRPLEPLASTPLTPQLLACRRRRSCPQAFGSPKPHGSKWLNHCSGCLSKSCRELSPELALSAVLAFGLGDRAPGAAAGRGTLPGPTDDSHLAAAAAATVEPIGAIGLEP